MKYRVELVMDHTLDAEHRLHLRLSSPADQETHTASIGTGFFLEVMIRLAQDPTFREVDARNALESSLSEPGKPMLFGFVDFAPEDLHTTIWD